MENGGNHNDGFRMPDGYFSDAGARLRSTIGCLDELRGYPALIALKGQNPFAIPGGYFERPSEAALTISFPRGTPGFIVPEGYFPHLEDRLRTDLALTQATGGKGPDGGFSAPGDYFGKPLTLRGAGSRPGIFFIPAARSIMFAAAAALLVVIGIWTYRMFLQDEADCVTIACLGKEDVLEKLSDDELMQFVDEEKLERVLGLDVPPSEAADTAYRQKNE